MLSSLKNVKNIKVLYKYKSELKEKIKINNSKIKVLYDLGIEFKDKIEKFEKNVSKIMKNHKKNKKFVCEYCAVKTLTKKDLEQHECKFSFYRGVPGHYGYPVYDHKLHEILIELNTLRYNYDKKAKSIKEIQKYIEKLDYEIDEIDEIIKDLLLVCQKCKKKKFIFRRIWMQL